MTDNKKLPENNQKLFCSTCNYICSHKGDWNKHIRTSKHINGNNDNKFIPKTPQTYKCLCGNEYNHQSGLSRHRKKCTKEEIDNVYTGQSNEMQEMKEMKEIMKYLMKENSDMKNIMLEQQNMMMKVIENGTHNTTNNINSNTNSHNKTFNLQFFLNETCKDAMNIMDFVESIKLQLSDLERVGELGYVEGISNIIVKNLKELDVTQRPVHCTDKKRETMYIKDEDKWEKDEENKKLHKVVRKVTCKNQNLIPKFKETHPDCNTYHSKFSDQYNKIIIESMGGKGDNDYEKEEKIIKNISKQVTIEK